MSEEDFLKVDLTPSIVQAFNSRLYRQKEYRDNFYKDPKGALRKLGISLSDKTSLRVIEGFTDEEASVLSRNEYTPS